MPRAAEPFGRVRDRSVYLPDADALVAADLHLGRTVRSAVQAPLLEGSAIVDRLLGLVDRFGPAEVVLAGDILDAFDVVPRAARDALDAMRMGVADRDATLVVLAGNHDAQLERLLEGAPADAHELDGGTVVAHGHERPPAAGRRYVVGHDHPAIEIEGRRRPCFLYGQATYEDRDVLALPAFNPAVAGTTVNRRTDGEALSPLLADVSRFRPVVWDADAGKSLVFPPLADLRPYL